MLVRHHREHRGQPLDRGFVRRRFRRRQVFGHLRRIDVAHRHRMFGEHGQAVGANLGEATIDEDALGRGGARLGVDRDRAGADRRDQRCVPHQHAKIARPAGHDDHMGGAAP